jgi:hypothetical protein
MTDQCLRPPLKDPAAHRTKMFQLLHRFVTAPDANTSTPRSASLPVAALQQFSLPPQRAPSFEAMNTIFRSVFKEISKKFEWFFRFFVARSGNVVQISV